MYVALRVTCAGSKYIRIRNGDSYNKSLHLSAWSCLEWVGQCFELLPYFPFGAASELYVRHLKVKHMQMVRMLIASWF